MLILREVDVAWSDDQAPEIKSGRYTIFSYKILDATLQFRVITIMTQQSRGSEAVSHAYWSYFMTCYF